MEKILMIDSDKCNGCRICELVCSMFHEKSARPSRSRIHVMKWPERAVEFPMTCQHCEVAMCEKACPVNAINRDEYGAMLVAAEKCIGCKLCVFACPFGGSVWDPEKRKIIKCNLCSGDPQCAKFCPPKAIEFVEPTRLNMLKKRAAAERMTELSKLIFGLTA